MKMSKCIVVLGLGLVAAASVQAADTSGMKMDGMKMDGMKMEEPAKATVNRTKGVVKELDAKKGMVTLSHDPVPALKWPAMTRAFQISPELVKGIEVGQKVDFEFETKGMAGTITKISPAR
jgi:Cu(I)/Ag(I) efflux system periplasmic protein CusF